MSQNEIILPADYADWLLHLKQRIAGARQRAVLSANQEQIRLYHDIGRDILERQNTHGWGAKVIERIALDLREAFPDMKGFSVRNLHYMRLFAEKCPNLLFLQQTAAEIRRQPADQLPWFHIVIIITKLADPNLREWYARETVQQAWSRDTLTIQIKNQLVRALPEPLDTCLPTIEELEKEFSI